MFLERERERDMSMEEEQKRVVVVALDNSEHSFHALQWALNTLPLPSLLLLHAKLPTTSRAALAGAGYVLSSEIIVSMERAQDREIEAFMNRALELCKEKQVVAKTKVVFGDARDVICEVIKKVNPEFLVIGSHGYGAIKRVVLGSVSDYCVHHAKCPVIIVKKPHKEEDHHKD